jgi:hypothetical protein
MDLLDGDGILDLSGYDGDFNWREHIDIMPKIKGFNVRGYDGEMDFFNCNLFGEIGILDLSGYRGERINFGKSNIMFKELIIKDVYSGDIFINHNDNNLIKRIEIDGFIGYNINISGLLEIDELIIKDNGGDINVYSDYGIGGIKKIEMNNLEYGVIRIKNLKIDEIKGIDRNNGEIEMNGCEMMVMDLGGFGGKIKISGG